MPVSVLLPMQMSSNSDKVACEKVDIYVAFTNSPVRRVEV